MLIVTIKILLQLIKDQIIDIEILLQLIKDQIVNICEELGSDSPVNMSNHGNQG